MTPTDGSIQDPRVLEPVEARSMRQNLLAQLRGRAAELETKLASYDGFSLLSQLAVLEFWHDPETYKEYEHGGLSAHVEYVAQLLLKATYSQGQPDRLLDGFAVESVRDLVGDIFGLTYQLQFVDAALSREWGDPVDDLRSRTVNQELHIRGPGYLCHLRRVLYGIFGDFDEWLLKRIGFTVGDAILIGDGITRMLNDGVMERATAAAAFSEALCAQAKSYRHNGPEAVDDTDRAVVERLADLSEDATIDEARNLATAWYMYGLRHAMEFDADRVAAEVGLRVERVGACLDYFCQEFGSEQPQFYRPEAIHRIRARPLLKHGDRYLSPRNGLFVWAVQSRLEEALTPRWEVYQKGRARFLEQETVRVLSAGLRNVVAYQGLHYAFDEGGGRRDFDVDGLVLFDNVLFIIEGKAGALSDAARRGAKDRIRGKLGELVADPSSQAHRAERYIRQSHPPMFADRHGSAVTLDEGAIEHFIHVTVTLDTLGAFTTVLDRVAELGIFQDAALPWAVSILDLMAICDLVEFPSQLLHFLNRRLRINHLNLVDATDELDWFGHYLYSGLYFDGVTRTGDEAPDRIILQSCTTEIDEWYMFQEGTRKTPAPKPHQQMPEVLHQIIEAIEAGHPPGHSAAVCTLLDLSGEARARFSTAVHMSVRAHLKDGRSHDFTLLTSDQTVGVSCFVSSPTDSEKWSDRLRNYCALKKHQHRANRWLGLCFVCERTGVLRLDGFVLLAGEWRPSQELDQLLDSMRAQGMFRDLTRLDERSLEDIFRASGLGE
jgi:hypothetical protein